jgi:hypothetical protein
MGLLSVGLNTSRTLNVVDGSPWKVFYSSFVIGVVYWISISFIADKDVVGYCGFTLGAAVVTTFLAHRRKK